MFRIASRSLVLAAGTLVGTAHADIIHVPGDRPTIQAGINNALSGDEVVLADGVYTGAGNRDITFGGKSVTVRSASGDPASVTIDCEGASRAFIFEGSEAGTLADLTIANGFAGGGAGGAVRLRGSSAPTISGCVFVGSTASGGTGGAIIAEQDSQPTITGCHFAGNTALSGSGGGVGLRDNSISTVIDCVFEGNDSSGGSGGGLATRGTADALIVNCVFLANSATQGQGGGIAIRESSTADIVNCTLYGNIAPSGGIAVREGAEATIANCVVWGNNSPQTLTEGGATSAISYSNIEGGAAGAGNIDANPGFADPNSDDVSLLAGSPCIDAGDNAAVPAGVGTDVAGAARFVDDPATTDTGAGAAPLVDMGAHEHQAAVDCPGDTNGNNEVELDDLLTVLGNFGGPGGDPGAGDVDSDGDVDLDDLLLVLGAFGTVCG